MLRFAKSALRRLIFGSILVSAAASAQMSITSSAFINGDPIPDPFQYNQGPPGQCPGGNNWSPPLAISGIPTGTNTLAIYVFDDTNPWLHWFAWGIPVSGTSVSLPYNYAASMPAGTQAANSFGTYGYGGPCAPPDGQTHLYVFVAYALTITGTTQPTSDQLNAAPNAILLGTRVYGQTVPWTPPTTPVISLASGANPSTFGQNVTFTATLSNGNSPTGTVTFNDGTTAICTTVSLNSGTAQCSTSTLAAGSHSISAVYSGDANNVGVSSNTVIQQVNQSTTSTIQSTNCMTTFVENQPFTLTARVTGTSPTGSVTFSPLSLCSNVAVNAGSATCTTSELTTIGGDTEDNYSLIAIYSGDANNAASVSTPLAVKVLSASDVIYRNSFEADSSSCPVE